MPLNFANSIGSMAAGLLDLRADSSRFVVVFDSGDYDLGSWSKVGGMGVSHEMIEYRTGDTNEIVTVPGISKYQKLTMSRAVTMDSALVQEWLVETARAPKLFSGSLELYSALGFAICSWTLRDFTPSSWKLAELDSKGASVVVETLEITHRGFLEDGMTFRPSPKPGPKIGQPQPYQSSISPAGPASPPSAPKANPMQTSSISTPGAGQ